jgi:RNA polymerase sigma factor (sigma-70 family)
VADIDKELEITIQGCIRKVEKSQELLYKRFFGYALTIAMIYNSQRDEAMDVVNDSFVKVFSEIRKFDNTQPFKGWLRKVVINTTIDRYRKNNKKHLFCDIESIELFDENPGIISNLTAQDILILLNKLPDIHKMVFQLYEIEGYSHEKIAEMLNIPESSSRVYLTRTKKKLRELFPVYFNIDYEKFGN